MGSTLGKLYLGDDNIPLLGQLHRMYGFRNKYVVVFPAYLADRGNQEEGNKFHRFFVPFPIHVFAVTSYIT